MNPKEFSDLREKRNKEMEERRRQWNLEQDQQLMLMFKRIDALLLLGLSLIGLALIFSWIFENKSTANEWIIFFNICYAGLNFILLGKSLSIYIRNI